MLYTSPAGAVQIIFVWVGIFLCFLWPNRRCAIIIGLTIIPLTGIILLFVLPLSSGWGMIAASWLVCWWLNSLSLNLPPPNLFFSPTCWRQWFFFSHRPLSSQTSSQFYSACTHPIPAEIPKKPLSTLYSLLAMLLVLYVDHYSGTLKMHPGIVVVSYWLWLAGLFSFPPWWYIGMYVLMRTSTGLG